VCVCVRETGAIFVSRTISLTSLAQTKADMLHAILLSHVPL